MHLTFVYVILLNRTGMIDVICEHILIKRLFTSLALLFNLSLLGVSSEIEILFFSDFRESARPIISLGIWLDVLSEFKSLVSQCNIMWSG